MAGMHGGDGRGAAGPRDAELVCKHPEWRLGRLRWTAADAASHGWDDACSAAHAGG